MQRTLLLLILFVLGLGCTERPQAEPYFKNGAYYSGVNLRFEGKLINEEGLFFDGFGKLPAHTHPKDYDSTANITRYSYHSVVEKEEDWKPKNNSLEIIDEGEISYLRSSLSPGQFHEKISGYRAELTLHGGNKDMEEEWFEWRFMIPESLEITEENQGKESCIVQFHYVKPENEPKAIKGPTVLFSYMEQYAKNFLILRYGINGEDKSRFKGHKWKIIALDDSIEKGTWYTMRVNIKWSLTNEGYIAVWLNGKPFTPFNGIHNKVYGANLYNKIENTFKFGYYRYWDNPVSTAICFDYLAKMRSYEMLTGKKPTPQNLYGLNEDYRYLEDKEFPLKDIHKREE